MSDEISLHPDPIPSAPVGGERPRPSAPINRADYLASDVVLPWPVKLEDADLVPDDNNLDVADLLMAEAEAVSAINPGDMVRVPCEARLAAACCMEL